MIFIIWSVMQENIFFFLSPVLKDLRLCCLLCCEYCGIKLTIILKIQDITVLNRSIFYIFLML